MILAYNTNGLAHHRLLDALELCARLGYGGVAITADVAHLDPYGDWESEAKVVRERAERLGLRLAVETGARFVIDPANKHEPNLMSVDPAGVRQRLDFYERCLRIAVALGAPLISIWSGAAPEGRELGLEAGLDRLATHLAPLLPIARDFGVQVAFEPEPGMFLETPEQYRALKARGGSDLQELGMTLDVGHCLVTGGPAPEEAIHSFREDLIHVHLDDIADQVHVHRMFGEGDLNLPRVLGALQAIEYQGMAAVELSRDSHRGAWAAEQALRSLKRAL